MSTDQMSVLPWTKYYPPGALDELDVSNKRLPDLLSRATRKFGVLTALSSPSESWTYERLGLESQRLAEQFKAFGITPGVRVAIYLPNMPEYVAALFGIWLVEGTVVQVNAAYVAAEVTRILEHSGASLLVTTTDQLEKLRDSGVSINPPVCLVGGGAVPTIHPAGSLLEVTERDWPDMSPDIALLQYTGGTTGLPKAVMLTHSNILSNIQQRMRVTFRTMDVPSGARVVNTLPMSHVFGLTCVTLMSITIGLNQLIVPRFQARGVLQLIRDAKPFAFFGVPTMYTAFLREPELESFGLDQVSVFNSSGAQISQENLILFELRTGARILDGFGMSEASPTSHTNPPFLQRRIGSAGIPVPFTEARIVDATSGLVDVPIGEIGELALRGPQIMKGYWSDPELTAQTLINGWLLTGDLAKVDEDGYLYIVGRQKDVIVASGYNIYPAEIEQVIGKVPGVAEIAVVGVKDDYRGETIKAVIVPVPGYTVERESVIDRCRTELAPFKIPTVIEFVDELPRTAVGKIDKRKLALSISAIS